MVLLASSPDRKLSMSFVTIISSWVTTCNGTRRGAVRRVADSHLHTKADNSWQLPNYLPTMSAASRGSMMRKVVPAPTADL